MKKDAAELIAQIGEIVRDIWKHSENPELLSKALNDIAVLNWALGQWQSEFEEQERMMKAEIDLERANLIQTRTDAGDAVNKAEIRATIALGDKRREYNKMVSSVSKVKICRNDNDKVIDAARSRLSLIKEELRG